jgi:hypothetical protein
MAADWFYRHDNQDKGPIEFSSLKDLAMAGQLAPADLVKQRGAMHWQAAGDVPGLFPGGDDDTTTTPPTPASTG